MKRFIDFWCRFKASIVFQPFIDLFLLLIFVLAIFDVVDSIYLEELEFNSALFGFSAGFLVLQFCNFIISFSLMIRKCLTFKNVNV